MFYRKVAIFEDCCVGKALTFHVGKDTIYTFPSWIITRENGKITVFCGNGSHGRTLGAIPFSSTPQDGQNPSFFYRIGKDQQLFDRGCSMCIVDPDGESANLHNLHATADRQQLLTILTQALIGKAQSMDNHNCLCQIVYIHHTQQTGMKIIALQAKGKVMITKFHMMQRKMCCLHTDADTGMLGKVDQLLHIAEVTVVHNGSLRLQIAAQLEFGIAVMHSGQVIIQMILCDIRINDIIKMQKADAVLINGM